MIPLPSGTKIKESQNGKRAIFEIGSLYPGYGATIGNSLRRVLLSSLEGAAVTQVKIEGVQHEFSTIDGVMEDVINIILNLKQLNFKVFSDEPQKATLSVKGEKEVKAGDFNFPTQVEIVNPEAPIATLTDKDAKLEMEVKIEKGIGFVLAEEMKQTKEEVGQITIDAIFTPVKAVDFGVRNMRVGERTDFDRLTIEVETDGSITPEKAFDNACEILIQHFTMMKNSTDQAQISPSIKKEKSKKTTKSKWQDFQLSSRIINILEAKKLTPKKVKDMKVSDLLEVEGIGEKSAGEILKAVKEK